VDHNRPPISITLFVVEGSLRSRFHRCSKVVRSSASGRGERGHLPGVWVARVLEQHVEIAVFDFAKDNFFRLSGTAVNANSSQDTEGRREAGLLANFNW